MDLPPFISGILFPVEKQTCGPETRALHESFGPVISDCGFPIFLLFFQSAFCIPYFGCPPALPEADNSGFL